MSTYLLIAVTILWSVNATIAGQVMTVLGPISPDDLGVTLMHDHIAFAYPGWFADESVAPYDRDAVEAKALKFLEDIKSVGVKTVVDPSMCDVGGRDPILCRNLARKTGLNIILGTGLYHEAEGSPVYFKFNQKVGRNIEDDICELFMRELTVGIGKTGVKAGIIKVASGDPKISDYEKTVFKAAVRASKETGVPITTHCQGDTVGIAQQELLLGLGADTNKIIIGHQNNSVDINYHLTQLQKPGFYLGFDRTGMGDVKAENCIIELVKKGYADRIMLSHDAVAVWLGRPFTWPEEFKPIVQNYYPTYIHKKFIPKMKAAGVTDAQIKTVLVENPRRYFMGR
ncbi:MAG: phosphotriesterase family protein [Planctomycetota bacterium]